MSYRFLKISASSSPENTPTDGGAVSSQSNSPPSSVFKPLRTLPSSWHSSPCSASSCSTFNFHVRVETRGSVINPSQRKMNEMVTRHFYLSTFSPHTSSHSSQLLSFRLEQSRHQCIAGFTAFGSLFYLSPAAALPHN